MFLIIYLYLSQVFFHTFVLPPGELYSNPSSREYDIDLDRNDFAYVPANNVIVDEMPRFELADFTVRHATVLKKKK